MTDQSDADLLTLTAAIVVAQVTRNQVAMSELGPADRPGVPLNDVAPFRR